MAYYAGVSFNELFKRDCITCPPEAPACPESCPDGQVCSLTTPTCDQCSQTICVARSPGSSSSSPASKSSGPNIGAIVGGVLGGLLVVAVASYLVWKYFVQPRRAQYDPEPWVEERDVNSPEKDDFTMRRDARSSTHTVGSIASTVLTRASNIIQIAYIPGVTNRSAPTTPGLLVPPVPPIPIALSDAGSPRTYEHEHFFMPGDLRDSTYTAASDRTSYARNSVASTIYGKNAVVTPIQPQTMIRGKAAVVSVKSTGGASTPVETPPIPTIDLNKYSLNKGPPSPAFSVGSTFLSSATATQMRPQQVKLATITPRRKASEMISPMTRQAPPSELTRDSNAITIINDTPSIDQGPFADPPRNESVSSRKSVASLSAVIDEAQKRANSQASQGGQGAKKEGTPFGDEHELEA